MNEIEAALLPYAKVQEIPEVDDIWLEVVENGLPAEIEQANKRLVFKRRAEDAAGIYGRPIDLLSLLRQTNRDGLPKWCLADPNKEVSRSNGCAVRYWRGINYWCRSSLVVSVEIPDTIFEWFTIQTRFQTPSSFPILPQRVRELCKDKEILGKVTWMGILYKPEEWIEIKRPTPDPALIVEWESRPDEYFALAIWGGDKPEIMEFVS